MTQTLSISRLANLGAEVIFSAFETYRERFGAITCRGQSRFEERDWLAMRGDAAERLDLYREVVDATLAELHTLSVPRIGHKLLWASMKAVYSGLIARCHQWELAETFFNSITRRIFATVGVDSEIEFVDSDFEGPPTPTGPPIVRVYGTPGSLPGLVTAILDDAPFQTPYQDVARDARLAASRIARHLRGDGATAAGSASATAAGSAAVTAAAEAEGAEIITSVFYRGNAAYLVGRLFYADRVLPLVLSLRHPQGGIVLDAVLLNENEVSILFGFAHSYFHVDIDRPYDLVQYLKLILPRKRTAELYIAIGFNKQGKTELYRDLLHHLAHTADRFDFAPGEHGLVMAVFTMPSYDVVFKVIKDHFQRPKATTRRAVMAKYQLIYRHDRAGRLVDAQEFEHLRFPRALFTADLLEHLCRAAGHSVMLEDDFVHIRHCYVERRVSPLNLYLRQAGGQSAEAAAVDYGRCIKDLMAVNIFPGDLLLKNFGVTSNGRVVFYDYDEVLTLTDCNFRDLPARRSDDEELADQPWHSVAENDVFPAEFAHFLGLQGRLRTVFLREHADLFEAGTWRRVQEQQRAGTMLFITPYEETRRLRPGTPSA